MYVSTREGSVYVAFVIDVFARRIVVPKPAYVPRRSMWSPPRFSARRLDLRGLGPLVE